MTKCAACEADHELDDRANGCDYEPCGTCGFDHAYEPDEAYIAHQRLGEREEEEPL